MDSIEQNNKIEPENILDKSPSKIDYLKDENIIDRISSVCGRGTRTSTVYKISYNSKQENDVVDFFEQNKNSLNIKYVYQEKQSEKNNEKNESIDSNNNNNINSEGKIFLIVDQNDGTALQDGLQNLSAPEELNLNLTKVKTIVRSTSDGDVDKENKKVKLTKTEKKILDLIVGKKQWALKTLNKKEQVDFITKLIKLADDNNKEERLKLVGENNAKPDEYRYFLNLIFNTNYLTYDALIKLTNHLYKKEISLTDDTNLHLAIKSIWHSIYTDLSERDISGKRDRMKVMISPEYKAANISAHIKLAECLREKGLLNKPEDKKAFYNYVITFAKCDYSKLHAEFWLRFLLYVVGLSFLITLAGVIVTALLGLVGFSQLAACAVLLVSTLISTGSKFRTDYKIFPWDWVYWWKDAKANCLICLKDKYMEEVLCDGDTKETIDKELPGDQGEVSEDNKLEDSKDSNEKAKQNQIYQNLKLDEDKKTCKDARKRYGFLFYLSLAIFIVVALTWYFPAVVAKAISLVLTIFKLKLTFTIPAIISSIAFWVAIVALVVTVIFYIKYKNNRDAYPQKKFDVYQKYLPPKDGKCFMRIDGNHKYYTEEELKNAGIEVIKVEKPQPKNRLENNNNNNIKTNDSGVIKVEEPKSENQFENNTIGASNTINGIDN